MSNNNYYCLFSGEGSRGGELGSTTQMSFSIITPNNVEKNDKCYKISVFFTALKSKEILCQAIIKKIDEIYICNYKSPNKKGFYELHIKINENPSFGSPFPMFFSKEASSLKSLNSENTKFSESFENNLCNQRSLPTLSCKHYLKSDIPEYTKTAVKAAIAHLWGTSNCHTPLIMQLESRIQQALHLAQVESSVLKLYDTTSQINLDKINEFLFSYGDSKLLNFQELRNSKQVLIKFDNYKEANEFLEKNGKLFSEHRVFAEKIIDPELIEKNYMINKI